MSFLGKPVEVSTLSDLRAAYPEVMDRLRPFANALMRGPAPLTAGERELIAAFVSALNQCQYCYGIHGAVARQFGVDADMLTALVAGVDASPAPENLKPLLLYARKLTLDPARITEADIQRIRASGWGGDAVFFAGAVCAYFNMMNRLVLGFGLEADEASFQRIAAGLVSSGYATEAHRPKTNPSGTSSIS